MPELNKIKLSAQPVLSVLPPRTRFPVLLAAQDEPDAGKRNPTAGRQAVRGLLGLPVDVLTLAQAQAVAPVMALYAISSHGEVAPDPDAPAPPTWNGETTGNSVVLVQGLPGGTWSSEGILVLSNGGSQRVDVKVSQGTYTAQGAGAGTVTSVNSVTPDGTGNVVLPTRDLYGISANKRSQVLTQLFTSSTQFKAVDVALGGDTSTGLGSRFADFANGDVYELLPDVTNPMPDPANSGQMIGTPTWLRTNFS